MLRRTMLKGAAAGAAVALLGGRAGAEEVLKMGISIPLTGAGFNAVGRQLAAAIKLYVQQHGNVVAGRKLELTIRDDGGVADNGRRIIQEMIVNEKVNLIGVGTTPVSLAVAPLITEAKIPALVLSSGASITVTKSPYMVRAGFLVGQQSWIMAEWAFKNGSKRVVTLVNDWAPGIEAETAFKTRFTQAGGEIIESIRIPLANPDFAPFLQRIRDINPDTAFIYFPGTQAGIFAKQFAERGLGEFRHQDHRARRSDRRRRSQHHGRSDARHHHGRLVFGRAQFRAQQVVRRRLREGQRLSAGLRLGRRL